MLVELFIAIIKLHHLLVSLIFYGLTDIQKASSAIKVGNIIPSMHDVCTAALNMPTYMQIHFKLSYSSSQRIHQPFSVARMMAIMQDRNSEEVPKEFLETGRTGRRNAMPDILHPQGVEVSTADLPSRLQQLVTSGKYILIKIVRCPMGIRPTRPCVYYLTFTHLETLILYLIPTYPIDFTEQTFCCFTIVCLFPTVQFTVFRLLANTITRIRY